MLDKPGDLRKAECLSLTELGNYLIMFLILTKLQVIVFDETLKPISQRTPVKISLSVY